MTKIIIILCSILLILSIWIFLINDEQELGNGYYFLPKYEAIDIGFTDGGIIYNSNKKYLFQNVIIKSNIKEAKYNNDFIIAIQEQLNLNQHNQTFYYIINKNDSLVYGPCTPKEYLQLRRKLGVPESLKINE